MATGLEYMGHMASSAVLRAGHNTIKMRGSKHCVVSKSGKNLGCSPSHKGAVKRLREVEFFKHRGNR